MLVLCGSSISNYYNKVKLALLEKGVAFSEEYCATGGSDEAVLGASPLAKIPFLRTDAGPALREPGDPRVHRERVSRAAAPAARSVRRGQGARARDLRRPAPRARRRDLYPKAFFGGSVSEATPPGSRAC
jgi:glutathione S-transferase